MSKKYPKDEKRPQDPNQLAKLITDIATGETGGSNNNEKSDKKKGDDPKKRP